MLLHGISCLTFQHAKGESDSLREGPILPRYTRKNP